MNRIIFLTILFTCFTFAVDQASVDKIVIESMNKNIGNGKFHLKLSDKIFGPKIKADPLDVEEAFNVIQEKLDIKIGIEVQTKKMPDGAMAMDPEITLGQLSKIIFAISTKKPTEKQ